jgi:hypothetical protein
MTTLALPNFNYETLDEFILLGVVWDHDPKLIVQIVHLCGSQVTISVLLVSYRTLLSVARPVEQIAF